MARVERRDLQPAKKPDNKPENKPEGEGSAKLSRREFLGMSGTGLAGLIIGGDAGRGGFPQHNPLRGPPQQRPLLHPEKRRPKCNIKPAIPW